MKVEQIDKYRWKIPVGYKPGMLVPGLVFASQEMMKSILSDQSLDQVANMAFLPGIVNYSLAMPDIHQGYGFPIGGIAGIRANEGVISPGGVGFDINCGVRLLRTNLYESDVRPRIKELVDSLYLKIPSGVGSKGKIKLKQGEIDEVLIKGSLWAVEKGFGKKQDIETTEENGQMPSADPAKVSFKAKERGIPQLGTLGSGNHFLEVGVVDKIYDFLIAKALGIDDIGQVLLLIHCGSRGLGHQVADDYIKKMQQVMATYKISLPDRQLACGPIQSDEGQAYIGAMRCAANFAWANRQCIMHWVRESFCDVLNKSEEEAGLELIYDVGHNMAKIEKHNIKGNIETLCIHRKGATRAFPPGHSEIPLKYTKIGQPVLIPGDMGRFSYVLVGTEQAMKKTFGSTCHGAGRIKSRAGCQTRTKRYTGIKRSGSQRDNCKGG